MKVVRRDRFELSLSDYRSPVLTPELSEHLFRLSECQASFRFVNHI